MTIGEMFDLYGSDKNSLHSYSSFYEDLLRPVRFDVTSVLEVGFAHGGSLRAWRDFFPNAEVHGIDNHAPLFTEDRIQTFRADSTVLDQLDAVLGDNRYDLIVDDGCHWAPEQSLTWGFLWPRVKPGGWFVAEDVQNVPITLSLVTPTGGQLFDFRKVKNRADDVLVLWRKPGK